jgi:hypothetical protein
MNNAIDIFSKKVQATMFMLETKGKQNPMENPHIQDQTEYAFNQTETYVGMKKFSKMLFQL